MLNPVLQRLRNLKTTDVLTTTEKNTPFIQMECVHCGCMRAYYVESQVSDMQNHHKQHFF